MPSATVVGACVRLRTSFPAYGFLDGATIEFGIFWQGADYSLAPFSSGLDRGVGGFECGVSVLRRNAGLQDRFPAGFHIVWPDWPSGVVFLRHVVFQDDPASAHCGNPFAICGLLLFDRLC